MRRLDCDVDQALAKAKERRHSIMPNPGFLEQLRVFRRLGFVAPTRGEFRNAGQMQRLPKTGVATVDAVGTVTAKAKTCEVPVEPGKPRNYCDG
jgi:hypothetical protein